jgi:predicted enzyme related to lactoylglutathione lyase
MSSLPLPSAVVFAKDVARLAAFYEAVAGLVARERAADHVVLETPGFQLVVHGLPQRVAAAIEIGVPPRVRKDTPIKLALPVASIAAARREAAALGGRIAPPARAWEARGFRACDGHDPEGNVFQVRETACV